MTLTSVDANGVTQTADFYEGRFQVQQRSGGALVTLRLRGGDFSSCPQAGGSSAAVSSNVRRGLVKVTDFVLDKAVSLPAGKSYLARRP